MFKYVLFTMVFGGLIGGCGEDANPGGGSGNEGEGGEPCPSGNNDKDGDSWPWCGEELPDCDDNNAYAIPGSMEVGSDGFDNNCDGVIDDVPPGGENEQCGKNASCQEPFTCLPCDEVGQYQGPDSSNSSERNTCWRHVGFNEKGESTGVTTPGSKICTCPQWFEGVWWAEYSNIDTHGYPYDMTVGNVDRDMWRERERIIEQRGCVLRIDSSGINDSVLNGYIRTGEEGGKVNPPPSGFRYLVTVGSVEGEVRPRIFTGSLSPDHNTVTGTCDGAYSDGTVEPSVWFHITCTFTLTRRE